MKNLHKIENMVKRFGLLIYKYPKGTQYYISSDKPMSNSIYHLTSGEEFKASSHLMRVQLCDLPKHVIDRAVAVNPVFRYSHLSSMPPPPTLSPDQAPDVDDVWEMRSQIEPQHTKESQTMTQNLMNFEFGPIKDNTVVMSPFGIAVATSIDGKRRYGAWNKKKGNMVDVTGMTFDMNGMFWVIPAQKISSGDIVKHNGEYVFVVSSDGGGNKFVDATGKVTESIPRTSVMGLNFYQKVMSPFTKGKSGSGFGKMMKAQMAMSMFSGGGNSALTGNDANPMTGFLMMSMMGDGDFDFTDIFEGMDLDFDMCDNNNNDNNNNNDDDEYDELFKSDKPAKSAE